MTKYYALAASVAVLALLSGTYVITQTAATDDALAACRAGQAGGAIGGPFELVDDTGATVTDEDIITGPTLIYFGYTFCPDVCPLDVQRNAQAVEILEQRDGIEVTPVFISIDPERDTVEVVRDFADNFHDRMIGLTGTPEQVKAASQAYRTYYAKQESDDEFYLVDHSVFSYLVFPEIGFQEFYGRDIPPEELAESVACFVEAAEQLSEERV